MNTAAETLRRVADWCEANNIAWEDVVSVYHGEAGVTIHIYTATVFERVAPGTPDAVSADGKYNQPHADIGDGMAIMCCRPLPAPPSASPVSPDAAEGGSL